jgi:hypothetical protein
LLRAFTDPTHPTYRTDEAQQPNQTEQLLKRAIDARGGLAALETMKGFVVTADTTLSTPNGKVSATTKSYVEYPARLRVEARLSGVELVQVYADGAAWVRDPGGVHDAPPEMVTELAAGVKRDVRALLLGAAQGQLRAATLPEEGFQGRVLKVLEISGDDLAPVRLFLDPQTAHVVKMSYQSGAPNARDTEELFGDYRTVDGLSFPFKASLSRGGTVLVERLITAVELNPEIDPEVFQKPR